MIISGSEHVRGRRVYIPRVTLAPKLPDLPFVLRRRQFPVKLAWAMTINKAQGQSLARVGVYLPSPVFSHGQLYVAYSRAGSSEHIKVLVADGEKQGFREESGGIEEGVYTDNVVWQDALLNAASSTAPRSDREIHDQHEPLRPKKRQLTLSSAFAKSASTGALDDATDLDEGSGLTVLERGSPVAPSIYTEFENPEDFAGFGATIEDAHDLHSSATSAEVEIAIQLAGEGTADDADVILGPHSSGAASTVNEQSLLAQHTRRAKRLNVHPAVWEEVSRRPAADRELFLAAESAPASSGGAASSSSRK